jgi:hypothetical protein
MSCLIQFFSLMLENFNTLLKEIQHYLRMVFNGIFCFIDGRGGCLLCV